MNSNPYAPPESEIEVRSAPAKFRSRKLLRMLCITQAVILLVGIGMMFYTIESILVTGALFSICGIFCSIAAAALLDGLSAIYGSTAPIFSIGIFLVIYTQQWNPSQADIPVKVMSITFAAVLIPFLAFLLMRKDRWSQFSQNLPQAY